MISPAIPIELVEPKTLGDRRRLFTFCIALLIIEAHRQGTPIALDTVKTDSSGQGHLAKGCHPQGLAADGLLYKDLDGDGQKDDYDTKTPDYITLGVYWKSLHPLCRFGGDFVHNPDGNHFSLLSMDGRYA